MDNAVKEKIIKMLDYTSEQMIDPEKLQTVIENGIERLRDRNPLLTDSDFYEPGLARTLLQNYCRYAFSNAEEVFETNYASDLITLRMRYKAVAENED